MKNLRLSVWAVIAIGSLGVLSAQAELTPLDTSCTCPTTTLCGKTAGACSAVCSTGKQAKCDCAPTSGACSAYGPYGVFKSVCYCS